jgi:hypothetical protein
MFVSILLYSQFIEPTAHFVSMHDILWIFGGKIYFVKIAWQNQFLIAHGLFLVNIKYFCFCIFNLDLYLANLNNKNNLT